MYLENQGFLHLFSTKFGVYPCSEVVMVAAMAAMAVLEATSQRRSRLGPFGKKSFVHYIIAVITTVVATTICYGS